MRHAYVARILGPLTRARAERGERNRSDISPGDVIHVPVELDGRAQPRQHQRLDKCRLLREDEEEKEEMLEELRDVREAQAALEEWRHDPDSFRPWEEVKAEL